MSDAVNEVLFGKLKRLRHTYRYSAQPVIERENVAEHSFWTSMIAMTIAHEVGMSMIAQEVAVRGLLHDIEECVTGDLVRDVKYATPQIRRMIRNVEEVFVKTLLDPLGYTGEKYRDIWQYSKDNTLSGEIVKLADMLCVISYCTQEMEIGNSSLGPIREECIRLIRKSISDEDLIGVAESAIVESDEIWSINASR